MATSRPVLTETLPIPPLDLTGRAPPRWVRLGGLEKTSSNIFWWQIKLQGEMKIRELAVCKESLLIVNHFRVAFYLCLKTSPGAKPFIWEGVLFAWKLTCGRNPYLYEWHKDSF